MNILKNFIVFEGLDGAGTTTQAKLLSQKIKNSFLTCEPTDNEIGKLIRKILKKEIWVDPFSLCLLFASDRNEHIFGKNGIYQRCQDNQIVICDRYLFSSLAYQSLDIDMQKVYSLNKDFLLPEIVFFLDTSLDECKNRIKTRNEGEELFEKETIQNKILDNYLKGFSFFEKTDMKIYKLNGNLPIVELLQKEFDIITQIGRDY
ncbi:MAG: dTMP kinase [Spirochaetes bacterium GWD1_27_9]|nr:MAG: dTMP kinase [Spirochaetes bacterium GWB1_27_13]OHD26519.1 MAG: dTMP kinase [Spirochaetes bacterium GWC1_27_15]OHD44792.1 MAG: dTMP kinase [Spirochaetes bacterium GWD1_27_9]